ncbi:MAG: type II toxin-antitoxin system prevent-host-death family antitoxin [Acidobacteriota bacterium]
MTTKRTSTAKKRSVRAARGAPPKTRWQLQTAKAQFSEVFRRARSEGPQWVTRQNKEAVVILPAEEFERQPVSLVEFFAQSPLARVKIDFERRPDYSRRVDL